jgi:hypothetical protein
MRRHNVPFLCLSLFPPHQSLTRWAANHYGNTDMLQMH